LRRGSHLLLLLPHLLLLLLLPHLLLLLSCLQEQDMDEAERQAKAERAGGNYGAGTKEMQVGPQV
jgi:hypothetical protein